MRNLKVTTTILAISFLGFMTMSCKNSNKAENKDVMNSELMHNNSGMAMDEMQSKDLLEINNNTMSSNNDEDVIALYLQVKDDLVAGGSKAAAEISKKLLMALEQMEISKYAAAQQSELKKIISEAKEHASEIAKSDIAKQREHFKLLSDNMIDLVTITGTESILYQQYCPMYDKGSSWLSNSKDIKNPYYGSKMLACGRVEKEFN